MGQSLLQRIIVGAKSRVSEQLNDSDPMSLSELKLQKVMSERNCCRSKLERSVDLIVTWTIDSAGAQNEQ